MQRYEVGLAVALGFHVSGGKIHRCRPAMGVGVLSDARSGFEGVDDLRVRVLGRCPAVCGELAAFDACTVVVVFTLLQACAIPLLIVQTQNIALYKHGMD